MMENAQPARTTVAWTKIIELHQEALRREGAIYERYGIFTPRKRTSDKIRLFYGQTDPDEGKYSLKTKDDQNMSGLLKDKGDPRWPRT